MLVRGEYLGEMAYLFVYSVCREVGQSVPQEIDAWFWILCACACVFNWGLRVDVCLNQRNSSSRWHSKQTAALDPFSHTWRGCRVSWSTDRGAAVFIRLAQCIRLCSVSCWLTMNMQHLITSLSLCLKRHKGPIRVRAGWNWIEAECLKGHWQWLSNTDFTYNRTTVYILLWCIL